jgi:hypothetical protein
VKSTYTLYVFISTLLLLLFGELVSFKWLQSEEKAESFFYSSGHSKVVPIWNGQHKAYTTLDPLLSWAINPDSVYEKAYAYEQASIVLEHFTSATDTLKIYISGGSTSDLIFDKTNWPNCLYTQLKEANYSVKIYLAAVGGYNSGQEYLKTIRDITNIQPDIHISYAGANEINPKGYYSTYEWSLYQDISTIKYVGFLPNLRKLINPPKVKFQLYQPNTVNTAEFWQNNMRYMHALSVANDYKFYSILQPVIYYGSMVENANFDKKLYKEYKVDYDLFYPEAQQFASKTPYVYDFTTVFQDDNRLIFKDDCHLINETDQCIIAQAVFELITDSLKLQSIE